jgi:hypothetical protein
MEIVAAVAIGLNPYVAALLLAGLTGFADRAPSGSLLATVPPGALRAAALCFALLLPVDLVLGKLVRFAPRLRQLSQVAAPASAAAFAAGLTTSSLPRPAVAVAAAVVAWVVAAALTATAARASRSPAWVGLGHVPVLMAAATAAAVLVPLGLAKVPVAAGLAAAALTLLAGAVLRGVLSGRRATPAAASRVPRWRGPTAARPV